MPECDDDRKLLGAFVRAHRERVQPEMGTGRRRTPGLRREELAARAGISTTWCTWIEQGRDVRVSPQALGRIAAALNLSRAERVYLFDLARQRDPDDGLTRGSDAPASLLAMMEIVPVPSYGLDRQWNACCWNEAARRLFRGWLGENGEPNLLRFVFLDPRARELLPDWENRARRVLAEFRVDYWQGLKDPGTRSLVEELRRDSALFARAWDDQHVLEREGGLRSFRGASGEWLHFEQQTFTPADRPDFKLVVLRPRAGRDDAPGSTQND